MKTSHIKTIPFTLAGLMLSANTLATSLDSTALSASDYYEDLYTPMAPCSSLSSTSASCSQTKFIRNGENYTVIETFSQAAVEGTSLKTGTEMTRNQIATWETLNYIEENFAPKTDSEKAAMLANNPEYFQNGVFKASNYLNENVIDTPIEFAESYASARWTDNWLITGGEIGTEGSMTLTYNLDGTLYDDYNSAFYDEDGSGWLGAFSNTGMALSNLTSGESDYAGVYTEDYDSLVNLTVDFTFGEEFEVRLFMYSESYIYNEEGLDDVLYLNTYADFINTATFEDIEVRDSYGNLLDNYGLESSSGVSEFESVFQDDGGNGGNDDSVEIPEPPLLALFALSAIFTLRRRSTHKHI